jgi:hypothetical protein
VEALQTISRKVSQWVRRKPVAMFSDKKARKWIWVALLFFVAMQIYFFQEMLAALVLFTGVFIIFGMIVLALYLIDRAGQWGLGWVRNHARPAFKLASRGWTALEDLSRKPFRRPRSEPAP